VRTRPPTRPTILPRSFFRILGVAVAARSRSAQAFPNPPVSRDGSDALPHAAGARADAQKHCAPARPDCAAQPGSVVVGGVESGVVVVVVVGGVVVAVIAATSPLTTIRS